MLSGEVFIKLPRGTKARVAQKAPVAGFIPIKGVATVPIGSEIDARKGEIEVKTASTSDRRGQRTNLQQGRFSAAMFELRQKAQKRAKAKKAVKRNGWGRPGHSWMPGVDPDPFGHDAPDQHDL